MKTTLAPYRSPNLPGFTFHDPRIDDYRRGQYLKVTAGLMGARPPTLATVNKQIDEHSQTITLQAPTMKLSETFATERGLDIEPPPTYDPVLRFYAYFRETVPESNDEEERVRYVRIHIYLEDDTIMIEEYRVRNSGMTQGVLLRRMRALNPHAEPFGTHYSREDFNVGISVEIYGVVYRIYACDKFTEEYFAENGRQLGEFEQPPDDLYTIKRKLTERPIRVTYIDTDKTHLRQFLDFDGKVLRFYAVWDDRHNMFGEKRKFIIHYFLADDCIEVVQVLPQNCGRDPVSRLLMKTKLPNPETGKPYTDADLRIGVTIDVFGRKFFLYDADPFTRQFVDQKFGKQDWTPINVDDGKVFKKTEIVVPPYNGWGDELDSLGSVYSLHPRPPRKNIVQFLTRDGQVLRFAAKFKNPQPQDRNRKFVIVFYLADDTVGVFELPQRNSGFREGRFIARSRQKNVDAGDRYFVASDFEVGKEVTINGFTFITDVADEYALNLMEAESDDYPQSDLVHIIEDIKRDKRGVQKFKGQAEFQDKKKHGYVEPQFAQQLFMRIFNLQQHEALTTVRRWTDGWGFDYYGFLSVLV